jgi:alpha-tubulin suppressor-like RCC1 family protein
VACGAHHTLAIANRVSIYAFGFNNEGQVGIDMTTEIILLPTLVQGLLSSHISNKQSIHSHNTSGLSSEKMIAVAAGDLHSVALSQKGSVYTWGNGDLGELGRRNKPKTEIVDKLQHVRVVGISAGPHSTAAVTSKFEEK